MAEAAVHVVEAVTAEADVETVQAQVQEANRKDNDTPPEMTTSSPGFFYL